MGIQQELEDHGGKPKLRSEYILLGLGVLGLLLAYKSYQTTKAATSGTSGTPASATQDAVTTGTSADSGGTDTTSTATPTIPETISLAFNTDTSNQLADQAAYQDANNGAQGGSGGISFLGFKIGGGGGGTTSSSSGNSLNFSGQNDNVFTSNVAITGNPADVNQYLGSLESFLTDIAGTQQDRANQSQAEQTNLAPFVAGSSTYDVANAAQNFHSATGVTSNSLANPFAHTNVAA